MSAPLISDNPSPKVVTYAVGNLHLGSTWMRIYCQLVFLGSQQLRASHQALCFEGDLEKANIVLTLEIQYLVVILN